MGQAGSINQSLLGRKSKKKKKNKGNDACIGNRKVRTIILSSLMIVFFAMGASWYYDFYDWYNDPNVFTRVACVAAGYDDCSHFANSWILILSGAVCAIVSSMFAILLFFINCDDKIGRIAGIGLIVGGLLYIIGWIWYIDIYNSIISDNQVISDDVRDNINAQC